MEEAHQNKLWVSFWQKFFVKTHTNSSEIQVLHKRILTWKLTGICIQDYSTCNILETWKLTGICIQDYSRCNILTKLSSWIYLVLRNINKLLNHQMSDGIYQMFHWLTDRGGDWLIGCKTDGLIANWWWYFSSLGDDWLLGLSDW